MVGGRGGFMQSIQFFSWLKETTFGFGQLIDSTSGGLFCKNINTVERISIELLESYNKLVIYTIFQLAVIFALAKMTAKTY